MIVGKHLVVVTHGMWGTPRNVHFLAGEIEKRTGEDTVVIVPGSFAGTGTYAGIEVCGSSVARDVEEAVDRGGFSRISFIGYSAGGLFNRFAIGLLEASGVLQKVTPVNFITIATPHYGVRASPRRVVGQFFNALASWTSTFVGGQTVAELTLSDAEEGGKPILVQMSEPGTPYMRGLARFGSLYLYANARADNTVGYSSAALAPRNPYRRGRPRSFVDGYDNRIVVVEPVTPRPNAAGAVPAEASRAAPAPDSGAAGRDDGAALLAAPPLPAHIEPHSTLEQAGIATGNFLLGTLRAALLTLWLPVAVTGLSVMRGYRALQEAQEGEQREALRSRYAAARRRIEEERHRSAAAVAGAASLAEPSMPGEPGDSAAAAAAVESDPAEVIRTNLWTLPFRRVDCYLPGFHTHGTIVVRTTLTGRAGMEVVRHILDTCSFAGGLPSGEGPS